MPGFLLFTLKYYLVEYDRKKKNPCITYVHRVDLMYFRYTLKYSKALEY